MSLANSPLTIAASWRPVYAVSLLLSLLLAVLSVEASRPMKAPVTVALLALFSLPVLMMVGSLSQYDVNGRPVLTGSELHEALSLYDEAREAMLELEGQRYLLQLSRPQARGVPGEYRAASERSREISERWNPAARANSQLPGQGFGSVLELLNIAADNQSDALALYLQNAEAPQPEIESAIIALSTSSGRILEETLPPLLEEARAGSVALLAR